MRTLLAYTVSSALHPAFNANAGWRSKFGRPEDSIVVTNKPGNLPHEMPQVIVPWMNDSENLNISAGRNAAMDYAVSNDYEWLVLLDVDSVWLGGSILPRSGFGSAMMFYTAEGDTPETFDIRAPKKIGQSSWFILRRDVFSRRDIRFHEGYIGYGYEDLDFNYLVVPHAGIQLGLTDAKAIHVWHPVRTPCLMSNKETYRRRMSAFGIDAPIW